MTPAEALELLDAAAAGLAGVEKRQTPEGVEWLAGGRPFAAAAGGAAEFRLEATIARAARGTADTSASARGPGWVRFAPAELDRFARDRAVAWLGSAHRHAARGG